MTADLREPPGPAPLDLIDLVRRCGAEVVGVSVLIELTFLPGRAALSAVGAPDPRALLTY